MVLPKLTRSRLFLALLLATVTTVASAQERPRRQNAAQSEQQRPEQQRPSDARESVLRLLPADAVTEHTVDIAGGRLAYTATAGTLSLFDQSGERSAAIYYTSYIAKGADGTNRPITFAFNGGPGAASAYLTVGLVGPRIAEFVAEETADVNGPVLFGIEAGHGTENLTLPLGVLQSGHVAISPKPELIFEAAGRLRVGRTEFFV